MANVAFTLKNIWSLRSNQEWRMAGLAFFCRCWSCGSFCNWSSARPLMRTLFCFVSVFMCVASADFWLDEKTSPRRLGVFISFVFQDFRPLGSLIRECSSIPYFMFSQPAKGWKQTALCSLLRRLPNSSRLHAILTVSPLWLIRSNIG